MTRSLTRKTGIFVVTLAVSYAISLGPVSAHGDAEHEEGQHTEMGTEQMEQMIKVLQQLVTLLTQYKAQYGGYVAPVSEEVAPVATHEEDGHKEEEHHEDHVEVAAPAATLIIEVETHNGKTHVHVRYTDKPEYMFFVSSLLNNEAGIIAEIETRTGLSTDVIKAALKYTGMNN